MTVDWTKSIQTRGGLKARYIGTVRDGSRYPVIVALSDENSSLETSNWVAEDGRDDTTVTDPSDRDIINVPVIEERWMNVYGVNSKSMARQWPTREAALDNGNGSEQGQVKITYHDDGVVGCEFFKAAE